MLLEDQITHSKDENNPKMYVLQNSEVGPLP